VASLSFSSEGSTKDKKFRWIRTLSKQGKPKPLELLALTIATMPRKKSSLDSESALTVILRRNADLDFLVIDKEGEPLMTDFFSKIDTTIMGRKTAAATAKMRENGDIPETPGMAPALQEDLMDELFIGLGPILLGDGVPGVSGQVSAARLQADRIGRLFPRRLEVADRGRGNP
jgi:hypothetical protein